MNNWTVTVADSLGKIWANTDQITKWLQVFALCLAGFWTYRTFNLGEAPSLAPTPAVEGKLSWEKSSSSTSNCLMSFHVSIENVGKSAFNIDQVRVRVWRDSLPLPTTNTLSYFDVDAVQDSSPQYDHTFGHGNLVKRYSPRDSSSQTYTWVIPQQTSGIYLVRADAESSGRSLGFGRQWLDEICVPTK